MNIRNLIIIIAISILVFSCGQSSKKAESKSISQQVINDTIQTTEDIQFKSLKKLLIDSLNFYSNESEFIKRDGDSRYVIYINELNKKKIAIIAITDSSLYLFKNEKNKWIQTDSILFDSYAFSFDNPDLNNDNNKDLIVYGVPNMHGQSVPFVFISNNDNDLHYREDLQLYNIRYNKKLSLIQSYYAGGVNSIHNKEFYKWLGDSLVLFRGVERRPLSHGKAVTIFYKLNKKKKFIYKKVNDNSSKIYDTALWSDLY